MNNETTASQPKSIGDDAQFLQVLRDWHNSNQPFSDMEFNKLVDYLNSRATADQASATIEAAPTFECGACHGSGWVPRDPDIGTEQECFCCGGSGEDEEAALVAQAATIQEPVMVAEPVDDGLPPEVQKLFDQLRPEIDYWCTHRRESNLAALDAIEFRFKVSQARTVRLERAALAAPMVADPAGVAITSSNYRDKISALVHKRVLGKIDIGQLTEGIANIVDDALALAATVKAVPSEALDPSEVQTIAERIRNSNFAAPLADKTGGGECTVPPPGWYCSRGAGHEGPCAASATNGGE